MNRNLFIFIILNCILYTSVYAPCLADPAEGLTVERIYGKQRLRFGIPGLVGLDGRAHRRRHVADELQR